jgi:ornithine cyclodeaminase
MTKKTGLAVSAAGSAEAAVRGSDIVVTITNSATPVFDGDWVEPGTHINAAGSNSLLRQEIDEATLRKCSPIVVDSRPTAVKEAGDLLPLLEKGRLHAGALTEIGEVINGTRAGRERPGQVTLFESQGMAIQDLIVAAQLAKLARERGLGSEVDMGG